MCWTCLGGLAAEEPGQLFTQQSCRGDPHAEETTSEHSHVSPSLTQEHEMEAPRPAGTDGMCAV